MQVKINITEQNIESIIKGIMASNSISNVFADVYTGVPQEPSTNTLIYDINRCFLSLFEIIFGEEDMNEDNREKWISDCYSYINDDTIPLDVKITKLYGDITEREKNV